MGQTVVSIIIKFLPCYSLTLCVCVWGRGGAAGFCALSTGKKPVYSGNVTGFKVCKHLKPLHNDESSTSSIIRVSSSF